MSKETDAGLRSVVRAAQRAAELAGRPRSGQLWAATRAARRYIQLKDSGGRLADGDGILNFREAIRAARQRGVVLPEVYYGELQDVARQAAFTASGLSRLAQIEELKQEMDRVFDEGGTFRDFKKRVRDGEIAPELSDHRLETILRTNTQGNLARGRCAHHARHKDTRPYLRYSAVNDSRTRASHAAQHGRVEPQDSDFWAKWTPPVGFNCRCTVTSLTERQAKRYQERDEQRQTPDVIKARQEAEPDPGFDYSPCDEPDRGMQESLKRHGVQQPKPIADEIEKLSSRAQTHDKVDPDPDDPREQWGETASGELEEHREAWAADTPPDIQEVIRRTPALQKLGRETGWPHHVGGKIDMDKLQRGTGRNDATWRHEYGHHVDNVYGYKNEIKTTIGRRKVKASNWAPRSAEAVREAKRDRDRLNKRLREGDRRKAMSDRRELMERLEEVYPGDEESAQGIREEIRRRFWDQGIDDTYIERMLSTDDDRGFEGLEGDVSDRADAMIAMLADVENGQYNRLLDNLGASLGRMAKKTDMDSRKQHELDKAVNQLADTIGSATNLKAGGGHKASYYKKHPEAVAPDGTKVNGIRESHIIEPFAHYMAFNGMGEPFRSGFLELMRHVIPNQKAAFDSIVERINSGELSHG